MHLASAISRWIRSQVEAAGKKGVVVGLSGGLDSALAAYLAVKGLGKEQVIAIMMPAESDPADLADAELVVERLQITAHTCDLTATAQGLEEVLPTAPKAVNINLKPRLRMIALYHFAALSDCLVLGTSNKSELELGYFTKYGDGGADLLPLGNLFKHEVVNLARELGVPPSIIDKPPSAGLFCGQTDEEEIGLTYNEIDYILKCLDEHQRPNCSPQKVTRIKGMMHSAEHKRQMPPIFFQKVTSKEEIKYKDLKIIPELYLVFQDEEPVEMTLKEYELLKLFNCDLT